jgi:hypothetical protein
MDFHCSNKRSFPLLANEPFALRQLTAAKRRFGSLAASARSNPDVRYTPKAAAAVPIGVAAKGK